ncbi:MAG TPA: DUF6502 family protein [Nitrospiraceae bacterium]|nr:DUF6502 family protein [Nitrospiraceae bacterium]
MAHTQTEALRTTLLTLLRPLIRICLRNGLSAKAFSELVKRVYADVAHEEFGIDGKLATTSRVAILTGLTRKEVQRLLDTEQPDMAADTDQYNRAASVLAGWIKDSDFADRRGRPAPLLMSDTGASFSELVRRYSGDMPARAMLDELLRVGAIKQLKDGRICLLSRAYVPEKGPVQKLAILGMDTADLIATIEHNLYTQPRNSRFQRKVMYDNVSEQSAKEFHSIAAARGQEVLEALDRWLAHRDRDVNPAAKGTGRVRLGIGVYHFEEPFRPPYGRKPK